MPLEWFHKSHTLLFVKWEFVAVWSYLIFYKKRCECKTMFWALDQFSLIRRRNKNEFHVVRWFEYWKLCPKCNWIYFVCKACHEFFFLIFCVECIRRICFFKFSISFIKFTAVWVICCFHFRCFLLHSRCSALCLRKCVFMYQDGEIE